MIPRIIGGALVLLSAVSFFLSNFVEASFFLLAGLILLFIPKKLASSSWNDFSSLDWKSWLKCSVVEAAFWLCILGLLFVSGILLNSAAADVNGLVQLDSLDQISVLEDNVAAAQSFVFTAIAVLLGSLIVWFFLYTVSRFIIWRIIRGKFSFWMFVRRNLVWWLCWSPVFLIVILGLRPEAVQLVSPFVLVLFMYFTTFALYAFTKSKRLSDALSSALAGAFRVHMFLIPIVYTFAGVLLVMQLFRFLPVSVSNVFSFLFIVLVISFVRVYFARIIKKYDIV